MKTNFPVFANRERDEESLTRMFTLAMKNHNAVPAFASDYAGMEDRRLNDPASEAANIFFHYGIKVDSLSRITFNNDLIIRAFTNATSNVYGSETSKPYIAGYPLVNSYTSPQHRQLHGHYNMEFIFKEQHNQHLMGRKIKELNILTLGELRNLLEKEYATARSLSGEQVELMELVYLFGSTPPLISDDNQSKELEAISLAFGLEKGVVYTDKVKSLTTILRALTYLSGGGLKPNKKTKFVIPYRSRKTIRDLILLKLNEEELASYQEQWKRINFIIKIKGNSEKNNKLLGSLHNPKKFGKLRTLSAYANLYFDNGDLDKIKDMFNTKPKFMINSLTRVYRQFGNNAGFEILMRLLSNRQLSTSKMYAMLKAFRNVPIFLADDNGMLVEQDRANHPVTCINSIGLLARSLLDITINTNLQYKGKKVVAVPLESSREVEKLSGLNIPAGTKVNFGYQSGKLIRVGVFWDNKVDIDLSMGASDGSILNWDTLGRISSEKCYHSGDNREGGEGSVEFIDIAVDAMLVGVSYYSDVRNYGGSDFTKCPTTVAFGFFDKDMPKVWDKNNCEDSLILNTTTRQSTPFVFTKQPNGEIVVTYLGLATSTRNTLNTADMVKLESLHESFSIAPSFQGTGEPIDITSEEFRKLLK